MPINSFPNRAVAPATQLRPKSRLFVLAGLLSCCSFSALAQTDTVRVGDGRLLTKALRPGLRQYLVYFQFPAQQKTLRFWFWLRDVQRTTRQGEAVIEINQQWFGSDTLAYRTVRSVNRAADFAPLYHQETGPGKTRAYNWTAVRIAGADSVAANKAAGYALDFKTPCFNWNLDIETLEMLPLATGKSFALNYYDAGGAAPAYVVLKVVGSEKIRLLDNRHVDCWKVFNSGTQPDGSPFSVTFWISKKGHEFLKEEDSFKDLFRYKVKLPSASPDLRPRFQHVSG